MPYTFIPVQLHRILLFFKHVFLEATEPTIRYYPVIQPLLFWQTLILACLIGCIAAELPLQAGIAAFTFIWIDSRYWKWIPLLFFTISFGIGIVIGTISKPTPPIYTPIWLSHCLEQRKPITITGTVQNVQSLTDNRLQIILEHVYPTLSTHKNTKTSYNPLTKHIELPSSLVWTWENPPVGSKHPLPGQQITATLMLRPIQGFRNIDGHNIATYWYRQHIYFQAWSKNDTAKLSISGNPSISAQLRDMLYQYLIQGLLEPQETQQSINSKPKNLYVPPEKSFIPALLFGDRFFLSNTINESICAAGLAHSLALSGQHLAVVSIAAIVIVMLLTKIFSNFFITLPRHKAILILSLPFAFTYLWLGNAPPSLIRATIMLTLWTIFTIRGSFVSLSDTIIIALLCILILDPQKMYSLSIQLSFLAVGGISLISPILYRIWIVTAYMLYKKIPQYQTNLLFLYSIKIIFFTLGITLTAQLATLPLTIYAFGYTSYWFLLNLLWLPVLGLFVLPSAFIGLTLCSIQLTTIGHFFINIANIPCEILVHLLTILEKIDLMHVLWLPRPHWTMILGYYLIFLSIGTLIGRTGFTSAAKRMLFSGIILLIIVPLSQSFFTKENKLRLRIMDVGQGQAILIEWGGRRRGLIDAGGFYSNRIDSGRDILEPILAKTHTLHLDFLAISHPHRDHIKGCLFLAKTFSIDQAFSAILPAIDTLKGTPSHLSLQFDSILKNRDIPRYTLARGDRIPLTQHLFLEVLSPPRGRIPKGNTGLILRLVAGNHGLALLPGDAEQKDLYELLKTNLNLQADVLVLPHHGSKTSLVPKFYKKVQPDVAVASTGYLNTHDFPSAKVHASLLQHNIPLRTTAQEGEIRFEWDLDEFL